MICVSFLYTPFPCTTRPIHMRTLSFYMQMCILPMYKDLEHRSPRRFNYALGASFAILFVLYASFATVAYLRFGPTVPSNVLNDLAVGAWGAAAKVGMSIVLLCVYPIMVVPMLAPVEVLLADAARGSASGMWRGVSGAVAVKIVVAGIVVSVMVATFFVSDLSKTSVISGTVAVGGFVALAPGLVGLWLSSRPGSHMGLCWRASMHALIWGGFAVSILGIFYRTNYAHELAEAGACWWSVQPVEKSSQQRYDRIAMSVTVGATRKPL